MKNNNICNKVSSFFNLERNNFYCKKHIKDVKEKIYEKKDLKNV